jgi:tetratricopeptide (TPR) repeat protein
MARALEQAVTFHQQGRLREAESLYEAVLSVDRNQPDALGYMGMLRLQMGKIDEAIWFLRRAVKREAKSAEAQNNLGKAFLLLKRYEKTVHHCQRAVAINPNFAEAHHNLAAALVHLRRSKEAHPHFESVVTLQPDRAESHYNLGNSLFLLDRLEDAIASYQRALSIRPAFVEALNNLGVILRAMNRYEEACRHFEQAIAINPGYAAAYGNLGYVLMVLGHLPEARHACEKAIALEPRTAGFYRNLFDLKAIKAGDSNFHALEALAREGVALPHEDQVEMHFALGKAYADLEQHERSFRHLCEGNALKRQRIIYDEVKTLGELDRIRAVFTTELMRSKQAQGEMSAVPVFIVGMPRSGTTLIEQILASHPNVFGGGELEAFNTEVVSLAGEKHVQFPEMVSCMTGREFRRLGKRYLERASALAPTSDRITDKMPANFRHVGLIHLALPGARVIHVRRDPADTCLSCFSKLFLGDLPYAYDLGELGRYYRAYEALMEHWWRVLPDAVMIDVQYEEVVADIEQQARRIVAHCGLEWDDACLSFHTTARPVRTASAAQVRRPIYQSSVRRWQIHREHLGQLFEALGGTTRHEPRLA